MSGILGIYSTEGRNVAPDLYYGLIAIQHRGQESCGIAVTKDREITFHKDLGLINEVITANRLSELNAPMGIGHVRYSRGDDRRREDSQPLVVHYSKGALCIAHSGQLVNTDALRKDFEKNGAIFQTSSDAELIAYAVARARLESQSVEEAVCKAMGRLEGSYSLVITSPQKLIAVKDPWGFRPLCMGRKDGDIIFASETVALDCIGATFIRELENGEVVVIDEDGKLHSYKGNHREEPRRVCAFEYIYFARPDSVISGQLVARSRRLAGEYLAKEHPVDADIVIGVPDSGSQAAASYASTLGLPCQEVFIKNRYISRTFIKPDQNDRSIAVWLKLNPIKDFVKGKRVCMVDDSIVRGTTVQIIIKSLRDAGAKEVHVRISSPPFIYPCHYGTDVPDKGHLLAVNRTIEEIEKKVDADSIRYLSFNTLPKLAPDAFPQGMCTACFNGDYPIVKRD